jgi:hypothetical protein
MIKYNTYQVINSCVGLVWLANGLLCKIFNLVPRHRQIVAKILGDEYASGLTMLIGLAEVVMAVWVFSRFKSKFNAIVQIVVIAAMNTLEFLLAPELLLWGRFNALFAFLFIVLIYLNEFKWNPNLSKAK